MKFLKEFIVGTLVFTSINVLAKDTTSTFEDNFNNEMTLMQNKTKEIKDGIKNTKTGIKSGVKTTTTGVKSGVNTAKNGVKSAVKNTNKGVKTKVTNTKNGIKNTANTMYEESKKKLESDFNKN